MNKKNVENRNFRSTNRNPIKYGELIKADSIT